MKPTSHPFTGRIRSFQYAFRGIGIMLASQRNAWIHAAATVLVCVTGCKTVFSEDLSPERDYDGVRVINPFVD